MSSFACSKMIQRIKLSYSSIIIIINNVCSIIKMSIICISHKHAHNFQAIQFLSINFLSRSFRIAHTFRSKNIVICFLLRKLNPPKYPPKCSNMHLATSKAASLHLNKKEDRFDALRKHFYLITTLHSVK